MLTQELFDEETDEIGREEGGEEGRAGEAAGGDEEEDDDDDDDDDEDEEEGYESPEYPFPPKARQRQMEEELNKDYDMNQE
jgi:hypothetical protein